jgi:hypothetical protein
MISLSTVRTPLNQGIVDISSINTQSPGPSSILIDNVKIALGTDYRGIGDMDDIGSAAVKNLRHVDRSAGFPRKFGRAGDSLLFWPIPDATYPLVITYHTVPAIPTNDSTAVIWPEIHLDVLREKVIMLYAERLHDWPSYDRAQVRYDRAMAKMLRDEGVTSLQTDNTVQEWSGWSYLT